MHLHTTPAYCVAFVIQTTLHVSPIFVRIKLSLAAAFATNRRIITIVGTTVCKLRNLRSIPGTTRGLPYIKFLATTRTRCLIT